jgi:hypothetical protein
MYESRERRQGTETVTAASACVRRHGRTRLRGAHRQGRLAAIAVPLRFGASACDRSSPHTHARAANSAISGSSARGTAASSVARVRPSASPARKRAGVLVATSQSRLLGHVRITQKAPRRRDRHGGLCLRAEPSEDAAARGASPGPGRSHCCASAFWRPLRAIGLLRTLTCAQLTARSARRRREGTAARSVPRVRPSASPDPGAVRARSSNGRQ